MIGLVREWRGFRFDCYRDRPMRDRDRVGFHGDDDDE